MLKKIAYALPLLCSFSLALAGCDGGEEDEPAHEEGNVNVEGCEHLAEGPSAPITAPATDEATAPAISNDHKRYDVTLADDGSGQKIGFVSFAPSEAVDFVFFLSADVPLAIEDAAGGAVTVEGKETSVPECTEVKARHQVALDVGTYSLRFGPTSEERVSVVVEEAGGHEH